MAWRAPTAAATRRAASRSPAMTIWPGALSFAMSTAPPSASMAARMASASLPISASIAPSPFGTASCM
jgi:hypothetical protein